MKKSFAIVCLLMLIGSVSRSQERAAPKAEPAQTNSLKMSLIPVKAGSFEMGVMFPKGMIRLLEVAKTEQDKLFYMADAPPKRKVDIDKDFLIGAHEVTIGQFREFVAASKYQTEAEKDGKGGTGLNAENAFAQDPKFTWKEYGFATSDVHPVANVSWNDAQAFCRWLSEKEKATYRLPTEAEWEYACRAGTKTSYSFGPTTEDWWKFGNGPDASLKKLQPKMTWASKDDDGHPYAAPVGSFKPNAWGIYDMHGNVIEWCQNRFRFYDSFADPSEYPTVPKELWYVHRGGSWFNQPNTATAHSRMGAVPEKRNSLIGFRVVRE